MKWLNKKTDAPQEGGTAAKRVSPFSARALRSGGYSVLVSLIVVAAIIAVNLFVGQIPTTYTKFDTTSQQLFSFSTQTTDLVSKLGSDVTLYLICQSGSEDKTTQELLARYKALSSHVTVSTVDPVTTPKFVSKYTTEELADNSVIVVSGERNRVVKQDEIYVTDYSNYYSTGQTETNFDGENALTSAIDYVTSSDLPVLYALQGHGETEISSDLKSAITKENMTLNTLNLLSMEALPEDMDCVIIYSPTSDLSTDETAKLQSYLEKGGHMLLLTDYSETKLPNLAALMANYGVQSVDGMVMEGDMNNCYKYVNYLLPNIQADTITTPIKDQNLYILMPNAQGIKKLDSIRSTLTVTSLLKTSDKAFSKANISDSTTGEKEAGDIDGPFDLAVTISETVNSNTAKIVWFGSSKFLDTTMNQAVGGANYDLFLNSLGWMADRASSISIRAKSLSGEQLTVPTGTANLLSLAVTILLPLLVIGIGILVFVTRRKR